MQAITYSNQKNHQSIREKISWKIAYGLKPLYFFMRRNRKAWDINMNDLQNMNPGTLGNDLYMFLKQHNLRIMPKAEFHDVYHVLFEYGTDIKSETLVQFVPLGNGRRSLPFLACTFVSALFYPEFWNDFFIAYMRGKNASSFHNLDFESRLTENTANLRKEIFG